MQDLQKNVVACASHPVQSAPLWNVHAERLGVEQSDVALDGEKYFESVGEEPVERRCRGVDNQRWAAVLKTRAMPRKKIIVHMY